MRLGLGIVLVFATLQGACRSPVGTDGVTVTTSISPGSLRPGSVTEIRITITNHGFVPRTVHASGCGAIRVTETTGADVGGIDADCDGSIVALTLQRGEQTVLQRPWQGDVRTGPFLEARTPLRPGPYRLQTRIWLFEGPTVWTGGRAVEARPVAVTVLP